MKKTILSFAIFASLFLDTSGQTYILLTLDRTVIFGPRNISNNQTELAETYISELLDTKSELIKLRHEKRMLVNELVNKKRLRKQERNSLQIANILLQQLKADLAHIEILLNEWNKMQVLHEVFMELPDLLKKGTCIEFITKQGTYTQKDVSVKINTNVNLMPYQEFFYGRYSRPGRTLISVNDLESEPSRQFKEVDREEDDIDYAASFEFTDASKINLMLHSNQLEGDDTDYREIYLVKDELKKFGLYEEFKEFSLPFGQQFTMEFLPKNLCDKEKNSKLINYKFFNEPLEVLEIILNETQKHLNLLNYRIIECR